MMMMRRRRRASTGLGIVLQRTQKLQSQIFKDIMCGNSINHGFTKGKKKKKKKYIKENWVKWDGAEYKSDN
jgi:hypothetical protein